MAASGRWPRTSLPEHLVAAGSPHIGPRLLVALLLLCISAPAMGAVGATLSLWNDDVFRGRSVSQGRPVATAEFSYDDLSGFYVGGTLTGVATRGAGTKLLDAQGYAGFAHRIENGPTIDAGITNTRYTRWYSGNRTVDYTEVYAGIISGPVSSHIRYSPHYFGTGQSTVYGDLDGTLRPLDKWRLNGHVGVLIEVSGPTPDRGHRALLDWRIDLSREIGRFNLQAGWAGAAPGTDYYADRPRGRSTFLVGAAYIF